MRTHRAYRAVLAALAAGTIVVACGGRNESTPQALSGLGQKPEYRRSNFNLGNTQPTVLGDANIQPLSISVNGSSATVSLWGSPCAPGQAGYQFCPGQNYTAAPPQIVFSVPTILTFTAATLNSSCPAGQQCYVVAYEGGVGPYMVQGPVSGNAPLAFPAQTTALNFNNATGYNFFLATASSISSLPPAFTPSPTPTATSYFTPAPTGGSAACGPFAVLAVNAQWANVHVQSNAVVNGDAGLFGPGQLHVESHATINGTARVVTGADIQVQDANITGGVLTDPATIAAGVQRAKTLNAADAALAPTNTISAIDMKHGSTVTITGAAGVNVLSLSSLEMNQGTALTLNAPAASRFVVNVSGEMRIGNNAQILLAGGITPKDVVFNFTGNNGQVWIQYSSVVNGTILAPYRTNIHVDHSSTVNGAVVGDGAVMEFAWDDTVGTGCGF